MKAWGGALWHHPDSRPSGEKNLQSLQLFMLQPPMRVSHGSISIYVFATPCTYNSLEPATYPPKGDMLAGAVTSACCKRARTLLQRVATNVASLVAAGILGFPDPMIAFDEFSFGRCEELIFGSSEGHSAGGRDAAVIVAIEEAAA